MFLGMNQNMVDDFDQNSNPSLDLNFFYIIQREGGGGRHAARFFVKRPVGLSGFWDLGICVLPSVT